MLGLVCLLLAALVVAAVIIVSHYDFNTLKPEITTAVKNATGRDLRLGGDLKLSLGFRPALVVESVTFENASWGSRPALATVKKISLQVALIPLVKGVIAVRRLALIEPDILIETDRSGKSNLQFETTKAAGKVAKKAPRQSRGFPLSALAVNRISIRNGKVTIRNAATGGTKKIHIARLSLASRSPTRLSVSLDGTYEGIPVGISGTFGGLAGLTDPTRAWPVSLTADAPVAKVAVTGTIRDVLHAKGLALDIKAQGESVNELVAVFHPPRFGEMGSFEIAGTLSDNRGHLAATDLGLQLSVGSTTHLELAGSIQDIVRLEGVDTTVSIEGRDKVDLEAFFERPLPLEAPFHITVRALKPADKPWRFADLSATAGKSIFKGSAGLDLSGDRPGLEADLSFQMLDLRSILSGARGGTPTPPAAMKGPAEKKEKVFSDAPFSLNGFQQLNATVDFRAAQALLPWLVFEDLTARAVLHKGHLQVHPFKSMAAKGTLEASVDLAAGPDPPKIKVKLNTQRVDLGYMLKTLGIEGVLEGKLDVELDLVAQGDSLAALMASLNGNSIVFADQGRINDRVIGLLRGGLKDIIHVMARGEKQTRYTEINCLVVGLDVTRGIAQSTALVLDTSDVTLSGRGKIDLAAETLDVSLKPTPKKGIGIKGLGKLSLSLGQLTKPLKLGGTLANPSVAIDPSGTMLTLGKAIGGAALLGPVGLAAALAGGKLGNQDPCAAAMEAAKGISAQPQTKAAHSMEKGKTQDASAAP